MKTINSLLQHTGLSQADIARSLGVSSALVSQVIAGKYSGDQEQLEQKIKTYLESYSFKESFVSAWVETKNVITVRYIADKAVRRQKMSVVIGEPGTGKTSALKQIATEMPESILIELEPKTSYYTLLGALCESTGVNRKGSNAATANALYAYFRKSRRVLLVDEGETLTLEALEGLRRLWDKTNTPIIIAGTHELERQLTGARREQKQLVSRIYGRWIMENPSSKEINTLCLQYGITDKHTIKTVTQLASGNLRNIANILQEMEDFSAMKNQPIQQVNPHHVSQLLML